MVLMAGVLLICLGFIQAENKITVQSMPPVVVKTSPHAGNTDVDPALKEIRVTFSKEMMTKDMWSWVEVSKDSFPRMVGEVRFLSDKRTCIAPVKLEPGKTYAIWLNSKKFNYFRDKDSNPAVPYLLVFQTRE
jgi:RNA polymerase sigma-70 factor (ECF subfamily)